MASGWAPPPAGKVGAELDQLAVDSAGRLVLIELKHAGASPASVYYAPLQLLQYVHEWAISFETVRNDLCALIDARREIGLSPADIPTLKGGLRPVIGFGPDIRSAKVRTRFDAVLAVAQRHLPEGVSPIEVWAMPDERGPAQIG